MVIHHKADGTQMTQTRKLGNGAGTQDLLREHNRAVSDIEQLYRNRLQGRIRTETRGVPANASDVVTGDNPDLEGDWLTDATYSYTLRSVSGTLKWDRQTLDVGW